MACVISALPLLAQRAHATCLPQCLLAAPGPGAGGVIPSNTKVLAFRPGPGGGTTPTAKVTNASGIEVPTTYTSGVLTLAASLASGTYTITWSDECDPVTMRPSTPVIRSTTFTTTAPAPTPTNAGTLLADVGDFYTDSCSWYSGPTCGCSNLAVAAKLSLTPSASLTPWLAITTFETWVDGKLWGTSDFGSLTRAPTLGGTPSDRLPAVVHTDCYPMKMPGTLDPGVSAGHHVIEVRTKVAGLTTLPALSVEVDLWCPGYDAGTDADASDDAFDADVSSDVSADGPPETGSALDTGTSVDSGAETIAAADAGASDASEDAVSMFATAPASSACTGARFRAASPLGLGWLTLAMLRRRRKQTANKG